MLTLLVYHTVTLLTFRPFLIFRARWRRDGPAKTAETQKTPPWLDDACDTCLEAARCLIRYLSDSYQVNYLVRVCFDCSVPYVPANAAQNMKYHGFFLESACFTLAFDMIHMTPQMAEKHLPWVRSGYRCLASMLPNNEFQEQISMTMSAIQQMLMAVFPDFAAMGGTSFMSMDPTGATAGPSASDENRTTSGRNQSFAKTTSSSPHQNQQPMNSLRQRQQSFNNYSPSSDLANPSTFFNTLGQNLMMTTPPTGDGGSIESTTNPDLDQLADFPPLDMNWGDIDFSSMDLDAFLSIDPTTGGVSNPMGTAGMNVNTNDLGMGMGLGLGQGFGGLR